jgi:hypothetical protein
MTEASANFGKLRLPKVWSGPLSYAFITVRTGYGAVGAGYAPVK